MWKINFTCLTLSDLKSNSIFALRWVSLVKVSEDFMLSARADKFEAHFWDKLKPNWVLLGKKIQSTNIYLLTILMFFFNIKKSHLLINLIKNVLLYSNCIVINTIYTRVSKMVYFYDFDRLHSVAYRPGVGIRVGRPEPDSLARAQAGCQRARWARAESLRAGSGGPNGDPCYWLNDFQTTTTIQTSFSLVARWPDYMTL